MVRYGADSLLNVLQGLLTLELAECLGFAGLSILSNVLTMIKQVLCMKI
jgi:hypothetical protein